MSIYEVTDINESVQGILSDKSQTKKSFHESIR